LSNETKIRPLQAVTFTSNKDTPN